MNDIRNRQRLLALHVGAISLIVATLVCGPGLAPAQEEETPSSAGARYAAEVTEALAPLFRQYGPHAINLQGNLMRYAIDRGALLETTVGIAGLVEDQDATYLRFTLDTGFVF